MTSPPSCRAPEPSGRAWRMARWSAGEPSTLPGVGGVLPPAVPPRPSPPPAPVPESASPPEPVPTPAPPAPPTRPRLPRPPQPRNRISTARTPFAATLNVARREIRESPLPARMRVSRSPERARARAGARRRRSRSRRARGSRGILGFASARNRCRFEAPRENTGSAGPRLRYPRLCPGLKLRSWEASRKPQRLCLRR